MQKQQQQIQPSEKLTQRLAQWKAAEGVEFASPQVKQAYQQRVQMLTDAILLKKPERVPVMINAGFFPLSYAGFTSRDGMYDYQKLGTAMKTVIPMRRK